MARKRPLRLKKGDREELKRLTQAGELKARTLNRCRILLLADRGKKYKEIAQTFQMHPVTVSAVCQRYQTGGLKEALHEKARSGAPLKFTGRQRAKITALACSKPPEGRSRWTLRLLADRAVELDVVDEISHDTVDRILKKTTSSPT